MSWLRATSSQELVRKIHDRMPDFIAPDRDAAWIIEARPGGMTGPLSPHAPEQVRASPIQRSIN